MAAKFVSAAIAGAFLEEDDEKQSEDAETTMLFASSILQLIGGEEKARISGYVDEVVPNYTPTDFRRIFRMNEGTSLRVLQHIQDFPELQPAGPGRREPIPIRTQLLVTLLYFGGTDTIHKIADRFGMSESTVVACRNKIVGVLLQIRDRIITWPNAEEQESEALEFSLRNGFPGIIGAIDGTHIRIKAPQRNHQRYVNRKQFHSIQLQCVCRHNMLFSDVFAGYPGSVHDSRVLQMSDLWDNSWILGDRISSAPLATVVNHHKHSYKMAAAIHLASATSDCIAPIPDTISVSFLPGANDLSRKSLERGLNFFQQGYIHQVKISPTEPVKVSAKCWPSMRKNCQPHKLILDIKSDRISDSYCSCKAGISGKCSHIIGLIKTLQGFKLHNFTHVPSDQSCTSMPQQWNKPRGTKIKPVRMNEVIVARPSEDRKRKPIICQTDMNYRLPKIAAEDLHTLSSLAGTPLESRISSDRPLVHTPLGQVQIGSMLSYQIKFEDNPPSTTTHRCGDTFVTRTAPIHLPEKYKYLNTKTICTNPQAIETDTRNQSSDLWFQERRKRLTASNFGKILSRKKTPNKSFLNSIFLRNNINAPSLEYGKTHEKSAKEKYMKKYPEAHFHDCGFVINNTFSFLGATPDGKICINGETGIVEIKCPYSARHMSIQQACQDESFFLEKINGEISLKSSQSLCTDPRSIDDNRM